jgi:hypothetical protein
VGTATMRMATTGSGAMAASWVAPHSGGARTGGITLRHITGTLRHRSSCRSHQCTSSHRLRRSRTGTTVKAPAPITHMFGRALKDGLRSCRGLHRGAAIFTGIRPRVEPRHDAIERRC